MAQENALSVYKEVCYISRFNDEEPISITQTQYEGLEVQLADPNVKFVKVGNRIINISSIKEINKVVQKPNTEIYAETGSNPFYREWIMGDKKMSFKEWVRKQNDNKKIE